MKDTIEILLVEDQPADARLTSEALKVGLVDSRLTVARDGLEAVDFLFHRGKFAGETRPHLILLDLNLPKKSGHEVLAEIKNDPNLRSIPVIILSSSQADTDIATAYQLHANCYVSKPIECDQYFQVVSAIKGFWGTVALLPGSQ
ncbi:response regulator [Verrucomicrobiota bacterium]|nr:response regulator [Verrucomicrobiota bacterium]